MASIYDRYEERGYKVVPAPRSNPEQRLDMPYLLRRGGFTFLRGETRDDLEAKMHRAAPQLLRNRLHE